MSLTIEGSGDIQLASEGTHLARCTQVIDLGHQRTEWAGVSKWSPKVLFGWELYGEGDPIMAWKRYTASLGAKANLRKDLTSWRGRQFTPEELGRFELSAVLGAPCMITIVHNQTADRTYANVESVTSCPKGTKIPERVGDLIRFDIDQFDQAVFETFGQGLQETIKKSRELSEQTRQPGDDFFGPGDGPVVEPEDDGIPFSVFPFMLGCAAWLASAASSVPRFLI